VLKEIIIAITAYRRAHNFIRQHRLWKWIVLPGILYMVLFIGGMYLFTTTVGGFVQQNLLSTFGIQQWADKLNSSLVSFLLSFTGLAIWLLLVLFYFSLFKYIWLIVGSPLFAWLSEHTVSIEKGNEIRVSRFQLFKDIWRGIKVALRSTLWQTVYFIALLLCAMVPVVGWVVPLFALLIEAYYLGFSMLDYSFERNNQPMEASTAYIGTHKGLAIGNGIVFYCMHLVPIVGWVLAPAYAVVAATLSMMEDGRNDELGLMNDD
jgi:CysZ protein